MRRFINDIVRIWHPTIVGFIVITPVAYLMLAAAHVPRFVTRDACDQIEIGMTLEEVQRILGRPGESLILLEKLPPNECAFYVRWYGQDFQVFVSFDSGWKVTSFGFHENDDRFGAC